MCLLEKKNQLFIFFQTGLKEYVKDDKDHLETESPANCCKVFV